MRQITKIKRECSGTVFLCEISQSLMIKKRKYFYRNFKTNLFNQHRKLIMQINKDKIYLFTDTNLYN